MSYTHLYQTPHTLKPRTSSSAVSALHPSHDGSPMARDSCHEDSPPSTRQPPVSLCVLPLHKDRAQSSLHGGCTPGEKPLSHLSGRAVRFPASDPRCAWSHPHIPLQLVSLGKTEIRDRGRASHTLCLFPSTGAPCVSPSGKILPHVAGHAGPWKVLQSPLGIFHIQELPSAVPARRTWA